MSENTLQRIDSKQVPVKDMQTCTNLIFGVGTPGPGAVTKFVLLAMTDAEGVPTMGYALPNRDALEEVIKGLREVAAQAWGPA